MSGEQVLVSIPEQLAVRIRDELISAYDAAEAAHDAEAMEALDDVLTDLEQAAPELAGADETEDENE